LRPVKVTMTLSTVAFTIMPESITTILAILLNLFARNAVSLASLIFLSSFKLMLPFEMRTVHSGIRLFIDTYKIVGKHFISNGSRGEESKIAERPREKVCERQCMVEKER